MRVEHVISCIHVENRNMIRVAEKLGETFEGRAQNSWRASAGLRHGPAAGNQAAGLRS
jgi:RimJ/RimL family protein N-acetyltransferase